MDTPKNWKKMNNWQLMKEVTKFPKTLKEMKDFQVDKLWDYLLSEEERWQASWVAVNIEPGNQPQNEKSFLTLQDVLRAKETIIEFVKSNKSNKLLNKFVKSPGEQKANGQKGGIQKRVNKLNALKAFIKEKGFDLAAYENKGATGTLKLEDIP